MRIRSYRKLPTERPNPATVHIDRLSTESIVKRINAEDARVPRAVAACRVPIARAVDRMVSAVRGGGRIIFIGAGTSGRLGVLEAAECPPTFNTPAHLVQAIMAGGKSSVFRSKEGAEDRGDEAVRRISAVIRKGDVAIGIAASGVTAYVREGLAAARRRGAVTILVTCHPGVSARAADVVIAVDTGPEVIAGSTRLKAGTATKLVLNALTVASMIRLGKVYGNRMVDLQPRSRKLRARAVALIADLGGVSERRAASLLAAARGNAKTAILMAKANLSYPSAVRRLADADGRLHQVLEKPPSAAAKRMPRTRNRPLRRAATRTGGSRN